MGLWGLGKTLTDREEPRITPTTYRSTSWYRHVCRQLLVHIHLVSFSQANFSFSHPLCMNRKEVNCCLLFQEQQRPSRKIVSISRYVSVATLARPRQARGEGPDGGPFTAPQAGLRGPAGKVPEEQLPL